MRIYLWTALRNMVLRKRVLRIIALRIKVFRRGFHLRRGYGGQVTLTWKHGLTRTGWLMNQTDFFDMDWSAGGG